MNVRKYNPRFVSLVMGTIMILAALALMAFAVPTTPVPVPMNHAPLQQSTITPTLTITTSVPITGTATVTSTATITPTTALTLTHVFTSTPMAVATPSGASPETAREPNGSWEFIPGNSKIWYAMTDSRMKLEVWLDLNGQKGVSMFVYAPEQKDLWTTKPIGQGTFNKLQPQHDLFWAGRTSAFGQWHVLIQNFNSFPVNYSLNYDRVATRAIDACAVCHGYDITFDGCVDKGDGFCGGLEDSIK